MTILDANVLIAFLDRNDAHHRAAVELLESRVAEGFRASVLTVAEAVVHPIRHGSGGAATAAFEAIGVETVAVGADSAGSLAALRAKENLTMPDAVVLQLALETGAAVATFDAALARATRAAGLEVVPVPGPPSP